MRNSIFILATFLVTGFAFAQSPEVLNAYQPRQHDHAGNTLDYRILYPNEFNEDHKYPLVVFLHGRGECGSDNQRQLIHGSQLFLDSLDRYPAVVIFPQCPETDYWANLHRPETGGAKRVFTFHTDQPPAPSLAAVISLIEQQLATPYIDADRLYIAGLSMGGMGVWELLWRMPDKIAAALPICGGGAPETAEAMLDIPIWAFHGMKDDVVAPNLTIRMVRAIQQQGGLAKVTLFPDANHNSWDPAFADPEFLSWMFSKRKSAPASPRVDSLMALMTLEEKIGQLNLVTQGGAVTGSVISKDVESKIRNGQVGGIFGSRSASKMRSIQEIAVKESRLGIPLLTAMDVIHGHQTVVPIPLGLSCAWDPELIEECSRMAAREATADGIMWNFSPMVDVARDPRWGRIAEGAGEDPYLGSRLAEAYVRGYQGHDLRDPTTMLACVKHFAAYGAPEGGRDYATVDMSKVRLFNEYLPPFEAAVDAGVGSIMTSFNVVDYIPASANRELFTDILRDQWGFDGFVVTDYTSINEMIAHGLGDLQEVSAQALRAGIDMDMVGEGFVTTLKKSLDEGRVTLDELNTACRRILMAKEQLGLLDDPYRYFDESRAATEILSQENRALARKAGGKAQVLLKNNNDLLPLSKSAKIALVGPLADSRRNMMGTWSVSGDHTKSVTVLEGMRSLIGSDGVLTYAKGANISDDTLFARKVNVFGPEIVIDERSPTEMIDEALRIARDADVVVAVMGEAADMSGEAASLADIGLQPAQKRLLEALKTTGKPVVMVLFSGRPMVLTWENENLDAILAVWHTGIEAGNAIADVLYGDVNPSGKLTASFPYSVGQIPVYHSMLNTGRPYGGQQNSKFMSNYLDIPNEPLYPFGYGLSYTTYAYSDFKLSRDILEANGRIAASVSVQNTGEQPGEEIVQMYIRDVVGSISRPMKELKGFQKIRLQPGESRTVYFEINEDLLKFYNSNLDFVVEPGSFEVFVGPNSRDVEKLTFEYQPGNAGGQ